MISQQAVRRLIGRPVGVSLKDGTGTSGILCRVQRNTLYILEYLYQKQFALKHYPLEIVDDVNPFPPCSQQNRNRLY